jgi:DNA-binding transcriptional MerR regulator
MARKLTLEGTKIAQAAKDLNVTTVTIRRYVAEFNIKTATDENGIKVLPPQGMEELLTVRQLKEEGLTNAQVLDMLAEKRKSYAVSEADYMDRNEEITEGNLETQTSQSDSLTENNESQEITTKKGTGGKLKEIDEESSEDIKSPEEDETDDKQDTKPKHSLTCQTCGKAFEHSNPRLRDCLDCYRSKRKERRRGGSKHKNVILHPLAQQAANNNASLENGPASNQEDSELTAAESGNGKAGTSDSAGDHKTGPLPVQRNANSPVRNYRKAIDETRNITSSLKRRLERPDLPEAERRWLEQVYAYQLILHQGWRHLSEYKAAVSE